MNTYAQSTINNFVAKLYNPNDKKNKNKWKVGKTLINEKGEKIIYVYGKPRNKPDMTKFNEVKTFTLANIEDIERIKINHNFEYVPIKINAGGIRIILNLTNHTWKMCMAKKYYDEENWMMQDYDYMTYYETDDYTIDNYENVQILDKIVHVI